MSLFKKLFGNGKDNQNENKIDIDALLLSSDPNRSIIELDNYISKLCSWGTTLEQLTEPQKNFYYNQEFEREINNGGLGQYFFNSSGDFAHQAIKSLQVIGANKTAVILQLAIDQFPGSIVPEDRNERQQVLEQIEEKATEVWEKLDQELYTYKDNLTFLNLAYVKQQRNSF